MYFALELAVHQVLPPLGCFEHGDAFTVAIAMLAGEVTKPLAVDVMDSPPAFVERRHGFRADRAARTCDKCTARVS
jgi:hypothetical protein